MTTEREAFEAWAGKGLHLEQIPTGAPFAGDYRSIVMQTRWDAWQAACAWQREQGESCARKPLAAQQLDALIERWVGGVELGDGEYGSMVMFAAAVEREHGIGIVETDGADKIRSGA